MKIIHLFLALKYLPSLADVLGFHGSMFLFSGVCIFGALFVFFYMPETKSKSYEEIMRELEK